MIINNFNSCIFTPVLIFIYSFKKHYFPFVIVFTISFCTLIIPSNVSDLPDSLSKGLNSSKIEDQVKAYSDIMDYYNKNMPEKAIYFGNKALQICRDKGYRKGEADILFFLGVVYYAQNHFPKSLENYQLSLNIKKEIKDNAGVGKCLNSMGLVYNSLGEFEKALDYCLKAINILENENDKKSLAESYNHLGIIYYILNDIPKAEETSLKALHLCESINEDQVLAFSHENLGIIYIKTKEFDKALYHVKKTLELRLAINDRIGSAGSYENLAIICRDTKKYDEALRYYNKSIELKNELNNLNDLASSFAGMGITYLKMKQYDNSLYYTLKALEMRKHNGEKRGIVSSLNRLAEIYSAKEDYKSALEYYKLAKCYNDSLLNEQKNKTIVELQEAFQREKRDKEIILLQRENIIQRYLRNSLLIITLLISVIAVFAYVAYRSKKRLNKILTNHNAEITQQKEELQNLNEQLRELIATKDKFFSIIAHDLKSPFQGFLGLTEIIAEDAAILSADELSHLGSELHKTANNLLALLKNLLEWAQMQKGSLSFQQTELSLNTLIAESLESIKPHSAQKEITIINEITESIKVFADSKMVNSVLLNLFSNAVKFTRRNGAVKINAVKTSGNMVHISISDSGVGITKELIARLFKVGEQIGMKGTEGELSTGLGLLLCKEFVEKHGGRIWVESQLNKGSIFSFTLPCIN